MKPLDFVRTPKGNIAIVVETFKNGNEASICFIGQQNPDKERNSWWNRSELVVVDSLPRLLAISVAHPFGNGREDAENFFGIDKVTE